MRLKPRPFRAGDESRVARRRRKHQEYRIFARQAEYLGMEPQSIRKTYQYKLKPTPEQEQMLDRTLMLCRHVYNAAVGERREAWRMRGISVTYYQQKAELPGIKAELPEYGEVHSQVLQDVILRAERTYQAFFRRCQEGERPGYPRFKGRNRYNSFTYPQYGNGAVLDGGLLNLSKIGRIPIRLHRPLQGTPKTITIRREADGWYASISCAEVPAQPLAPTGQETGIDLGLESFATRADGEHIHNPRHYQKGQRYLRLCQRRVVRRHKGSKRRAKAVKLLAKAHQHIANQRCDFHHKEALRLVREYDVVYHEDLRVRNMVKNHQLAKSISDAGWSQFLTILTFKAASAGKRVQAVNPAFTSQRCSGPACGVIVAKGLSVRWHACPNCGTSLHRDHNAALNILRLGREQRRAG
jgi:putative transposase